MVAGGPYDLEEGWSFMQEGINTLIEILEGNENLRFTSDTYMMLYTKIYDMCTQKPPHDFSQQLYEKYKGALDIYLSSCVLPSLQEKHGEFLLIEMSKRWTNHKVMIRWLSRFFNYLDRYYIQRKSLAPLNTAGICCFRDTVYCVTKHRVRDAVLQLIEEEREGKQIDRALLKNVLSIYVEIGLGEMTSYTEDFEDTMLIQSSEYYSRKAMNWIVEDSCPVYMLKSEESLRKERERVSNYLHADSETKLFETVQNQLLVVRATQLLEKEHSGCRVLLQKDKMEDLSRMYRLFCKIPKGLDPIAIIFKQHVTAEGIAFVQQAEDAIRNKAENPSGGSHEIVLVRKLIELHDKYMACVKECYLDHPLFHKSLKEAFEVFCNKSVGASTSAEILASYCDNFLKKGGTEKLSDEAIEDTVDKVVQLLVYISDKDLFAEFYRKKLSRRLLFDKSGNDEHERLLLSKLKQQCGGQYTSKMEGMVTDLTLARDHQSDFAEYLSNNDVKLGTEVNVTVLTTGFWPTYKFSELNIPESMADCVKVFKAFYGTKTKHRKLTWIYSLGTCNVQGKFDLKPIELVVSTFQAAALMLFNNAKRLSYSEIKTQLNLGDDELIRLLHSLSCAKYKILVKDPVSKTISTTDSFEFNSKFTDKMRRIRIPLPPVDERKKIVDDVGKDRRYAVDACVVRIMKARKVLGHQQLNMECAEQLSKMFKPDFKLIKKRIEDLISRDYLERDPENPTVYKYLA